MYPNFVKHMLFAALFVCLFVCCLWLIVIFCNFFFFDKWKYENKSTCPLFQVEKNFKKLDIPTKVIGLNLNLGSFGVTGAKGHVH